MNPTARWLLGGLALSAPAFGALAVCADGGAIRPGSAFVAAIAGYVAVLVLLRPLVMGIAAVRKAVDALAADAAMPEVATVSPSVRDLWLAVVGAGQAVGSVQVVPPGDYPVDVSYQYAGSRTVMTATVQMTVTPADFPVDAIEVGEEEAQLLAPELEALEARKLRIAYGAFTPILLWQGPFTPPVAGPITTVRVMSA